MEKILRELNMSSYIQGFAKNHIDEKTFEPLNDPKTPFYVKTSL